MMSGDRTLRRPGPERTTACLHPDQVRVAAEEAGIAPEFVQIALAEAAAAQDRALVFDVPKYDWGATANPPFVEKASAIGLRQLHVAIQPLPGDPSRCEVVVAGDLRPGLRQRWRWSAATSVGASAAAAALWTAGYRHYRSGVEDAPQESLRMLPTTARAIAAHRGGHEAEHPR